MSTCLRPQSSLGIHSTTRKGERRASTGDHLSASTKVSDTPRNNAYSHHKPGQPSNGHLNHSHSTVLRGRGEHTAASTTATTTTTRSRTPLNHASRSPLRRSIDRAATPDILEPSPLSRTRPRTGSDSLALSRSSSVSRVSRRGPNSRDVSPPKGINEKPRWVGAWSSVSTRTSTTNTPSKLHNDSNQNKEHNDTHAQMNTATTNTIVRAPFVVPTKPIQRRLSLVSNSSSSSSCTTISSVSSISASSISSATSSSTPTSAKDQSKGQFRKPDTNISNIRNKIRTAPNSPALRAVPSTSGDTSAREPANQKLRNARGRSDSVTGTFAARPAIQSNGTSSRTKLQESHAKSKVCNSASTSATNTNTSTNGPQGKKVQRGSIGVDHGEVNPIVKKAQPGVSDEERNQETETTEVTSSTQSPALIRRLYHGDTTLTAAATAIAADKSSGSTTDEEDPMEEEGKEEEGHGVAPARTKTKRHHPLNAPTVAVAPQTALGTFFDQMEYGSVTSLVATDQDCNPDDATADHTHVLSSPPPMSLPFRPSAPSSRASSIMSQPISAHEAFSRIMEQHGSRRRSSFGGRLADVLSSPRLHGFMGTTERIQQENRTRSSSYSVSEGLPPAHLRVSSIESFPEHASPPNEKIKYLKDLFRVSFLTSSTVSTPGDVSNKE
ncbi:MAG: hypothetical protein J3Q66DRAFT_330291 [Benniella sp.]|nr:MAG: hypothetical protein J3Q66DRAFT_330291 [Benniella sp.]